MKIGIQTRSRSMSDPTRSDIDFKNKMAWVWTTLKNAGGLIAMATIQKLECRVLFQFFIFSNGIFSSAFV